MKCLSVKNNRYKCEPSINKDYLVPSIGFKVDENPVLPKKPPPILGCDTENVLKEIGITKDLIKDLRKEGIIN